LEYFHVFSVRLANLLFSFVLTDDKLKIMLTGSVAWFGKLKEGCSTNI